MILLFLYFEKKVLFLQPKWSFMLQATHEFKKYDISYKGLSMEDM